MIVISQTQFSNANAKTPGQQYIIALWCELFNMDTIDSYRVRIMNANSILEELDQTISDRVNDDISLNNILFICREAERILSLDKICAKYYPDKLSYLIYILKETQKTKKDDDLLNLTFKIKTLSKLLTYNYLQLLTDEIKIALVANDLDSIQHFTKSLASELINKGFSFEYLYFLKDIFLAEDTTKTFEVRWDNFINSILSAKNNYNIYFKFSGNKTITKFSNVFDINISTEYIKSSVNDIEIDFTDQPGKYYGLIKNVTSYDATSAVSTAIKSIDMLRNLSRYEFRKTDFSVSPNFLVLNTKTDVFELRSSFLRPVGFIQHGSKSRFETYIESMNQCLSSTNLDNYSKERIINSFKYFRMSIDAEESEIRFILCWIALEFLLKTGTHSSIISRILYYLPKVISYQFFKKIIIDFSANISRMNIPDSITTKYFSKNAIDQFEIKSIYEFLLDNSKVASLKSEIQSELLKIRIDELSNMLSNPESLKQRFHRHTEDLEWNIQRIYRVRNKLVHSAETQINIRQLESNLTYYFTTLFNNIIYSASHTTQPTTIENILNEYDAKTDFLTKQILLGNKSYKMFFD